MLRLNCWAGGFVQELEAANRRLQPAYGYEAPVQALTWLCQGRNILSARPAALAEK